MMQCCLSLSLFLFYVELEPTNVRKNSHGCSEGIVQVFLPQLCWCYSVCVCVCGFYLFFIFLLFFPKVGSHIVLQPLYQTSFQTAPSRC